MARKRGNAATLKKYWLTGAGARRVRWNTPGDHRRCTKAVRKYLGPRAAAYCANLHKQATGRWPGDRRNR